MKAKELAEILMREPEAEVRMALDFKSLWGVKVKKGKSHGNPLIMFFHNTIEHTNRDSITDEEDMKVRSK